ncbi:MAG: protein O-mannosyl-transferase family, partial [Anaerolineae bacterium]
MVNRDLPEPTSKNGNPPDTPMHVVVAGLARVRDAISTMACKAIVVATLPALGGLLLYLRTLAPGVYVSDFAEFQYQPLRLGLPHPNGFPFYMLLGWLWSHLPMGSVAWRMNALSAVGGALAIGLTAGFAYRLSRRTPVAWLAAGLLALSPTFWYYSLAAERYTLNLALLAGCWWSAWEARRRQSKRLAVLSTFVLALGLATHPSDMLMLPFWLGYLLYGLPTLRQTPRFWATLAAAGAAPLLLYLYVPLRWIAFGGWPPLPEIGRSSAIYHGMVHVWYEAPLNADLLVRYILGLGGYAASFLAGGWQQALRLLNQVAPYWLREVPWALLALAGAGTIGLARIDAALLAGMGGFSVLLILMVSYITQGKNDAYLLPAFWTIFLWTGLALAPALDGVSALRTKLQKAGPDARFSRRMTWAATLLVLLAMFGLLGQRYAAADLSRASETARTWEVYLKHPLETGAGLLGHWSDLTPLWYLQQIEGRRPDLVGLFPPDTDRIIAPWLRSGRPLYLVAPLHGWALDLPSRFDLMPWGRMVRILPKGAVVPCPPPSNPLATPPTWPLRITGWSIEEPLRSEQPGILSFCWEARTALPRETFLRLRLRSPAANNELAINEPLLSTWYPLSHVAANTVGLGVIPVRLPLGALPGRYQLDLVPYVLHDDGPEEWPGVEPLALGAVTVAPAGQFLPGYLADEVTPVVSPTAGPLALRGWRVSQQPVRPGDPLRLELLWEVRSPVNGPLTIALSLRNVANGRTVGPAHT